MKSCPACQGTYPNSFSVCPRDGTALLEGGVWAEGTVLRGKYRILQKLGQGGMGAVYKALHLAFDELRALKVMNPELLSDELFVKRFKHEGVITRKLQHPNAVRVDDIDETEDGRPFIVMEYIEGQSLKKLIQDSGPLPVPRVCSIIKQAAAALDAAHRLGMVHRDIKPDNIVLIDTPEGEQVKILDFGIAKVKEARLGDTSGMTLTGTGVVIGTPQYMSPEQAMGKRGDELDGRSDLYSLGIVMYQTLTGDLPFKADTTMGMLLAHLQTPPAPIQTLHPELQIPEAIASLVMRTLEKDRELRPPSATALIEEIERAEGQPVPIEATRVARPTVRVSPHAAPASRVAAAPAISAGVAAAQPSPAAPVRPAPLPHAAPAPAVSKLSRWGLWAGLAILVVGLGGGAWYFTRLRPSVAPVTPVTPVSPRQTKPSTPEDNRALGTTQSVGTPVKPQEETPTPSPVPAAGPRAVVSEAPAPQPRAPSARVSDAGASPQRKPSVDSTAISAAIKMGDFYLNRGEYDNAIREYQQGLNLDPSNPQLRDKIAQARRAKAAEQLLNQ